MLDQPRPVEQLDQADSHDPHCRRPQNQERRFERLPEKHDHDAQQDEKGLMASLIIAIWRNTKKRPARRTPPPLTAAMALNFNL
ncbi:MAG: hypothetical protein R3E79_55565 [Caldilineaceae bacterium]